MWSKSNLVLNVRFVASVSLKMTASQPPRERRGGGLPLMEKLDGDILHRFTNGEHVMRHRKGLWNGIWSDMYIETTFMRYGHGPIGIVGITLKPTTLHKWAYSMHACSQLVNDIEGMSEAQMATYVTSHMEERTARIRADGSYRER